MSALSVFSDHPLLALLPAACFFVMARMSRRAVVWGAVWMWVAFATYGLLVENDVLGAIGGESRGDLVLIYPVLIVVSIVAALSALRGRKETEAP